MGRQRVWRIAPSDYETIMAPLRARGHVPVEVRHLVLPPASVFAVELNGSLADEMASWCAENEFPVRVVHTATIHFIELYEAVHAVLFKIRWV